MIRIGKIEVRQSKQTKPKPILFGKVCENGEWVACQFVACAYNCYPHDTVTYLREI